MESYIHLLGSTRRFTILKFFCLFLLCFVWLSDANSATIGLQDVYIFEKVVNKTQKTEITEQIIEHLMKNSGASFSLPGEMKLTASTIGGQIKDNSSGNDRDNDSFSNIGIIELNGKKNIIVIASTRLSAEKALGTDFNIEIDLTGISDITIGDQVSLQYLFLHSYRTPDDPDKNDPFMVFAHRANQGSVAALGLFQEGTREYDEKLLALITTSAEIVKGSTRLRYAGKGALIAGTTIGGIIAGTPGAVVGGILGGIGGFLVGIGTAIIANDQPDPVPCTPPPDGCYYLRCQDPNLGTVIKHNNGASCNDGEECTKGESCVNGTCGGGERVSSRENPNCP